MINTRNKVIENIAERLIKALSTFEGQWEKPFFTAGNNRNVVTGKDYRGINVLILAVAALKNGYKSKKWGTFQQWLEKKCPVKKGEKATQIIFWKPLIYKEEVRTENGEIIEEEKETYVARAYYVFNAEQVEGYAEEPESEKIDVEAVAEINKFFDNTKIPYQFGERACYSPMKDLVIIPAREKCISLTEYAATFAHEMTHATGHKSRLAREMGMETEKYAYEELIADIGAGMVCSYIGYDYAFSKNNLAYLKSWLQVFKDDPKKIVSACSQAQKAADYLIDIQNTNGEAA
jgi:antirestriction protein ArdC